MRLLAQPSQIYCYLIVHRIVGTWRELGNSELFSAIGNWTSASHAKKVVFDLQEATG